MSQRGYELTDSAATAPRINEPTALPARETDIQQRPDARQNDNGHKPRHTCCRRHSRIPSRVDESPQPNHERGQPDQHQRDHGFHTHRPNPSSWKRRLGLLERSPRRTPASPDPARTYLGHASSVPGPGLGRTVTRSRRRRQRSRVVRGSSIARMRGTLDPLAGALMLRSARRARRRLRSARARRGHRLPPRRHATSIRASTAAVAASAH